MPMKAAPIPESGSTLATAPLPLFVIASFYDEGQPAAMWFSVLAPFQQLIPGPAISLSRMAAGPDAIRGPGPYQLRGL